MTDCLMCKPDVDNVLARTLQREDDLWLQCAVTTGPTPVRASLEPKRRIPFATDMDGAESDSFGPVLARVTAAFRHTAMSERVDVFVFDERVPHLHVVLAPHHTDDALQSRSVVAPALTALRSS